MAPWLNRCNINDEPQVLYLLVDSRHYRRNLRPYKKTSDFSDIGHLRQLSNGFSTQRKIVIVRAKILAPKCFPNKSKRTESAGSWHGKGSKRYTHGQRPAGTSGVPRPTVLLPPMDCTTNRCDADTTAPVLSSRVQENNRLQVPLRTAPSAPSPGEVLYNSEDNSDMAFIVGAEEWRFPAHSFVVGKMERTLNALLESAESQIQLDDNQIQQNSRPSVILRMPSVKPKVFEQVLRFIYTRQVSLSSVESALQLLQPAHTYHLPELTSMCLLYISKNLAPSNVLKVLGYLLQPPPCVNSPDGKPPSECHHDTDNQQNELVLKCFQVLDYNADLVLQSEAFETLEYDVLVEVLKRDSLEVSSEAVVFEALMKWACMACKRQRKELTPANKCAVLGDKGLFLVRYLLMTPEEFLRGPVSHGVLSKEDREVLSSRISGDDALPLPEHWARWKLSVERKCKVSLTISSSSSSSRLSTLTPTSPTADTQNKIAPERKKKSMSKKFLNGVGDLVICVIQLLD